MYILWDIDGPASSPQSVPGEYGEWLPVIPAKLKDFNPVTQTIAYVREGNFVREVVSGSPAKAYWQKRGPEYPKLEDQLDAIWKGGEAMEEMRRRVMAVKEKYPK